MNMIQFLGEWIVRSSFLILTGAWCCGCFG